MTFPRQLVPRSALVLSYHLVSGSVSRRCSHTNAITARPPSLHQSYPASSVLCSLRTSQCRLLALPLQLGLTYPRRRECEIAPLVVLDRERRVTTRTSGGPGLGIQICRTVVRLRRVFDDASVFVNFKKRNLVNKSNRTAKSERAFAHQTLAQFRFPI